MAVLKMPIPAFTTFYQGTIFRHGIAFNPMKPGSFIWAAISPSITLMRRTLSPPLRLALIPCNFRSRYLRVLGLQQNRCEQILFVWSAALSGPHLHLLNLKWASGKACWMPLAQPHFTKRLLSFLQGPKYSAIGQGKGRPSSIF